MMTAMDWRVVAGAALLLTACSSPDGGGASLSANGVLRCAERAAVGEVVDVTEQGDDLEVEFSITRWLVPGANEQDTIQVRVDNPDVTEGAPTWTVGQSGLLVVSPSSPTSLLERDVAEEVEAAWDGTNQPSSRECNA